MSNNDDAEKKEAKRIYQKEYYLKNKQQIDKNNLEYYYKNKQEIAAKHKEKYKTKYLGEDGLLTTYHMEYYKKNRQKLRNYYKERYKTKGMQWYKNNKKQILLNKKEKYYSDKKKPVPPLAKKKEEIIVDLSNTYIPKSCCQAKTNEIVKNLEIMKIKAEAFKKSLNNN